MQTHSCLLLYLLGVFLFGLPACADAPEKTSSANEPEVTAPQTPDSGSEDRVIVFFGNSLSAGYGLETEESFPARIQQRLDSLGYPYRVVNAGVSGETSSGGTGRIDWVLRQPIDIFVLELGGNDGLRGIPPEQTQANLQEIIDAVQATHPEAEIILAGMQIPPNMGTEYTEKFRKIFPALAEANDSVVLLPFLLQGVGGVPALNQPDGIHPTAEGAKIVAENVWEVMEPLLEKGDG